MNFEKDKKTVFVIVAVIVVCIGSLLGIRAMTNAVPEVSTSVPTTVTTTAPTVPTTVPTTAAPTTTAPTTTAPTTTAPTTTAAPTTAPTTTTTAAPTTAATSQEFTIPPIVTQPVKDEEDVIENAALFDKGFLSYKYNPSGNYYYTEKDPWQRYLGYTEAYDMAAPFVIMFYDTIRCKFTYNNMDWLIQMWKGQYGYVFIGAEIGVYYKPTSRKTEFYDCVSDADSLNMSMVCYRDGAEIFKREYSKYWWCTGFVPGKLDSFSDRSELKVEARITMKDYQMLLGFTASLKANGFKENVDFKIKGLDVYLTWQ